MSAKTTQQTMGCLCVGARIKCARLLGVRSYNCLRSSDDELLQESWGPMDGTSAIAAGAVVLDRLTPGDKPPALPAESPRFDFGDGLREFLVAARRKEIHDEDGGRSDQMKPAIS